MKTKLFILLCSVLPLAGQAQINYSGGIYTQDFNTLRDDAPYVSYTNLPNGWFVSHGSYAWTSGSTAHGYSDGYGTYCFASAAGAQDKSLGLVIGTTGQAYFGAWFHNMSGVTLTSFSLSYFAEQWMKGAVVSNDQVIPFQYSLDATNLTSGTYTGVSSLDMHSINDGDGILAALDGNAATNRQLVTGTVSGISWAPNQDLWIRWCGVSHPFYQNHAMAVDDLFLSAVPQLQITMTSPTRLQVLWSTNYPGYTLQSAPIPTSASWDTVTNVPVIVGGEFGIEIDTTEALRFFRLKLQ
jgi:hypothetical protein